MGFLNNTTVTVDAILTKKGRELLAQGTSAFQVTKFALADDEVDYRLWDPSHPNGSNSYGAVIESMPLLEAFPDENHVMRYKLVTLPKNTIQMPILQITGGPVTFNPTTVDGGFGINSDSKPITGNTSNLLDTDYTFILHNQTLVDMSWEDGPAGSQNVVGMGSTPYFLGLDDAPNSYTIPSAKTVMIHVKGVASAGSTTLTVVGNQTGATGTITITNNVTNASITTDTNTVITG
tara:strand:+ start:697 stop:1401 length:705 start_codon:yes stop_codon:yes gene_type:complete